MSSLAERIKSPRRTFQRAKHAVGEIVRIETVVEDTRDLRRYIGTVVSAQEVGDALNVPEGINKLRDFERAEISEESLRLRRDVHIGVSASTGFVFLDVPIGPAWDHQVHPKPRRANTQPTPAQVKPRSFYHPE